MSTENDAPKLRERIPIAGIIIIVFVLLAITTLIIGLTPKTYDLTVTDVSWTRSVDIEKLQTFHESDWTIPEGAQVKYSGKEIHHYATVFSHYVIIKNGSNTFFQPVYRPEPVYGTKYYYDIDRWEYDYTATSSGHDQKPYWPNYSLESNQREGEKKSEYFIDASYKNKVSTYVVGYEDWQKAYIGGTLHAKVYPDNRVEILE